MGLENSYALRKGEIEKRLGEFKCVFEDEYRVFEEMCFCLLTPQSKARHAWRAIENLSKRGLLLSGTHDQIEPWLGTVRFHKNKARWISEAQKKFVNGDNIKLREKLSSFSDALEMRKWLVENVKGFGYKEASHFLRNIGFYENIAILDRHILKNMVKHGIIPEIPKSLTPKVYLELEQKMSDFSHRTGIPMAHLDLLFWSEETGEIFK